MTGRRFLLLALWLVPASSTASPDVGALTRVVWERREHVSVGCEPAAFRLLVDGSTLAVARCGGGARLTLARHTEGGRPVSRTEIDDVGAAAVAIDPFGDVYAGTQRYDGLSGSPLWDGSPRSALLGPVEVDGHGDIVGVFGVPGASGLGKRDGATGTLLWSLGDASPTALVLDPEGNVHELVSTTAGTLVSKVDGKTGRILWGPRKVFGGSAAGAFGGGAQPPARLLVDPGSGDVLVAWACRTLRGQRIGLARLASPNGELVWGPVDLPGPESRADGLFGMALDGTGGLLVLGDTSSANGWPGITVSKVEVTTGAVLWGPRAVSDTDGGVLRAAPIAFTPVAGGTAGRNAPTAGSDDLVVLGWRTTPGSETQLVAVKVSGSTGRVLSPPIRIDGGTPVGGPRSGDWLALGPSRIVLFGPLGSGILGLGDDLSVAYRATAFVEGEPAGTFESAHVDARGDVIVLGSRSYKLAGSDGRRLWENVSSASFGSARLDGAGDIVATGGGGAPPPAPPGDRSVGSSLVSKYSGATGDRVIGPAPLPVTTGVTGATTVFTADAHGDLFVSGGFKAHDPRDPPFGWMTSKLDGRTGLPIWGPVTLDGILHPEGQVPEAAAVASNGDLAVCGAAPFLDWWGVTVRRFDGATGAPRPGPLQLPLPERRPHDVLSLSADGSGGLVVLARVRTTAPEAPRFVLLGLDAASGERRWGPVSLDRSSSVTGDDFPVDLDRPRATLDRGGNVLLVATSRSGGGTTYLTKLSGATGDLLWSIARPGVAPAQGLTVDAQSDVLLSTTTVGGTLESTLWKVPGVGGEPVQKLATVPGTIRGVIDLNGDALVVREPPQGGDRILTRYHLAGPRLDGLTAPQGAFCGEPHAIRLSATGGQPPYSFTVSRGSLPPGLSMAADLGIVRGTPTRSGLFPVTLRLTDGEGASSEADLLLRVRSRDERVAVRATSTRIVRGDVAVLTVEGSHAITRWLPSGETSPDLIVAPTETTTYGVVVTDGGGCERRGTITIEVHPPDPPPLARHGFFTLTPCRLYDSRETKAPLEAWSVRDVPVVDRCGIPGTARAVVANVTAVDPTSSGTLEVVPSGAEIPSPPGIVSFAAGETRAAFAILTIGEDGGVSLACDLPRGTTDLVIDVSGYFQ